MRDRGRCRGRLRRVGFALLAGAALVGCRSVLAAIFDLPPPPAAKVEPQPTSATPGVATATVVRPDTARPAAERSLDAGAVRALLPTDAAGNVDWMAALRNGVIRPRSVLPGQAAPPEPAPFQFAFDFLYPGPDSTSDALFPHSSHTEWIACQQCHLRVVSYRNTKIVMNDVLEGRYCGECHGKVAFKVTGLVEGCERCHRSLAPRRESPAEAVLNRRRLPLRGAAGAGKTVYERWCVACHGVGGKGDGPLAGNLYPRPRDFTAGAYQIRTTASGEPPTDADLVRAVEEGLPGTAMPGWKVKLATDEIEDVVAYIKTLSVTFAGPPGTPFVVGAQPPVSPTGLAEGRKLFGKMECFKCHGQEGRGDGPSAPKLKDDLGFPIRPTDLTKSWSFNGGAQTEDVYMRLLTGLDGTPMPSYSDVVAGGVISEEQLWRLAQYVRSLSPERSPLGDLEIRLRRVTQDSTVAASDTIGFSGGVRTDSLPRARFPHWVHQIRYRCKACHTALFEPRAGANSITMKAINRGESCGRCHDGQTAFRAGFGQCERCHAPEMRPAREGLGTLGRSTSHLVSTDKVASSPVSRRAFRDLGTSRGDQFTVSLPFLNCSRPYTAGLFTNSAR